MYLNKYHDVIQKYIFYISGKFFGLRPLSTTLKSVKISKVLNEVFIKSNYLLEALDLIHIIVLKTPPSRTWLKLHLLPIVPHLKIITTVPKGYRPTLWILSLLPTSISSLAFPSPWLSILTSSISPASVSLITPKLLSSESSRASQVPPPWATQTSNIPLSSVALVWSLESSSLGLCGDISVVRVW